MSASTNPEIIRCGNSLILFDTTLLAKPDDHLFNIDWLNRHHALQPTESGRGESWFIDFKNPGQQNQHWVLRHYLRGGMVAKFNHDLYLAWQAEQTRGWKEWRLLHHMHALSLPVPRPVAARAHWPAGLMLGLHRADILLERIPQCSNLSSLLQQRTLSETVWRDIGQCLKIFHTHDIYHADLNANNILIDPQEKIYLIDFDRCRITSNTELKASNLPRLKRSLQKLQGLHPVYHFTEQNWQVLLAGYSANSPA
jgi:3-deoxy-D-manno-octulosonic acid kinase